MRAKFNFVHFRSETVILGALLGMRDSQGKTPAHLAASRDHCRVLATLASFNCDLDSPDDSGRTPAHYAAQSGGMQPILLLFKQ